MPPATPEFDLRCPNCAWVTICGPAQMADWLLRHRLIKSTSDVPTDLLVELFRTSSAKLSCPQCGKRGLVAAPSEALADEEWGQSRTCESCGAAIPPERLEVFPDARLCADCQQRDERGELAGRAEYCPRCGSIMVLRQSRGAGITRYVMTCPACRRTL
jgi:predicted RNA-binding Zn-ribbon protein involved in translation (DUF1610 family)